MGKDKKLQRYVLLLAEWANAVEGDPGPRRALMDPEQEFWCWVSKLIEKRYYSSFNRSFGWSRADFIQDCIYKLLKWAKQNSDQLVEPDFSHRRLAALIRVFARNHAISLKRSQGKRYYAECSGFSEEKEMPQVQGMPEQLQYHSRLDEYLELEQRLRRVKRGMIAFGRSIRNMHKMLQTHVAVLCYCHRLGMSVGLPRHWLAYKMLSARNRHLPEDLREFLRRRFSNDSYNAINSRIGYLKRALHLFFGDRKSGKKDV
jgi:hypothetical protein